MLPKGNVSKHHARLLFRDGRFIVTDLKSTNGTYVNGRKIAQATIVREGDKIYIGDFILRIDGGQGATEGEAPPPPAEQSGTLPPVPGGGPPLPPPPLGMPPMASPTGTPFGPPVMPPPAGPGMPGLTNPAPPMQGPSNMPAGMPPLPQPMLNQQPPPPGQPQMAVMPTPACPCRYSGSPVACRRFRSPSRSSRSLETRGESQGESVTIRSSAIRTSPTQASRRSSRACRFPPLRAYRPSAAQARPRRMRGTARDGRGQPQQAQRPPSMPPPAQLRTSQPSSAPARGVPRETPQQAGRRLALGSLVDNVIEALGDASVIQQRDALPPDVIARVEKIAADVARSMKDEGDVPEGVDVELVKADAIRELTGLGGHRPVARRRRGERDLLPQARPGDGGTCGGGRARRHELHERRRPRARHRAPRVDIRSADAPGRVVHRPPSPALWSRPRLPSAGCGGSRRRRAQASQDRDVARGLRAPLGHLPPDVHLPGGLPCRAGQHPRVRLDAERCRHVPGRTASERRVGRTRRRPPRRRGVRHRAGPGAPARRGVHDERRGRGARCRAHAPRPSRRRSHDGTARRGRARSHR